MTIPVLLFISAIGGGVIGYGSRRLFGLDPFLAAGLGAAGCVALIEAVAPGLMSALLNGEVQHPAGRAMFFPIITAAVVAYTTAKEPSKD